jgi:hypothetical protein
MLMNLCNAAQLLTVISSLIPLVRTNLTVLSVKSTLASSVKDPSTENLVVKPLKTWTISNFQQQRQKKNLTLTSRRLMLRDVLAVNYGFQGLQVATICPAGVVDNGAILVGVGHANIVVQAVVIV